MAETFYTAAGMTVDEVEAAVALGLGWASGDADWTAKLARIDQAITAVGQAVCTWDGSPWWWQRAYASFRTVRLTIEDATNGGASRTSNVVTITIDASGAHGLQAGQHVKISGVASTGFNGTFEVASVPTAGTFTYAQVGSNATSQSGYADVISYPLRSITLAGAVTSTDASKVAWRGWAIERAYYDDDRELAPVGFDQMRRSHILLQTSTSSEPLHYCLIGEAPYLWLWPAPSTAYDIHLDLVARHSKITNADSLDTALIIPAEYQWDLYVSGSEWLLKHEVYQPASLRQCQAFMDGIGRMRASDPGNYRDGHSLDMHGSAPVVQTNLRVMNDGTILNDPSL